jgi:hypothetical protein
MVLEKSEKGVLTGSNSLEELVSETLEVGKMGTGNLWNFNLQHWVDCMIKQGELLSRGLINENKSSSPLHLLEICTFILGI